jgi:hypothetical protein
MAATPFDATDDKNEMPKRITLKAWKWCGIIVAIVSAAFLGHYLWHNFINAPYGSCSSELNLDFNGDRTYHCTSYHWYAVVAPLIVSIIVASVAHSKYRHYYVKVYSGTVNGLDIISGHYGDTYYIGVDGLTLAGEHRHYWWPVSYNAWRQYEDGDTISFDH